MNPSFQQLELFERWKSIIGYEGLYEISDWGRVRSLARATTSGRLLVRCVGAGLYPTVTLCKSGCKKSRQLHRLVAEAFLGPCPIGKEIDHIDGDKTNAVVTNLRYVTSKENNLAMFRRIGKVPTARLTESQIVEIRRLRLEGMKYKEIGKLFDTTPENVSSIVRKKTWKEG